MGTSAERSSAMTDYYKRGHYIPGLRIDGMDVLAVLAAVRHGRNFVKGGNGPLVYEYTTYRYAGHSMSDPGIAYRSRDELQKNRENDPLSKMKTRIIDWGIMTDDEVKSMEKDVRSMVNEKVRIAEEMPPPIVDPDVLFEDIYVAGSEPAQRRGRTVDETWY